MQKLLSLIVLLPFTPSAQVQSQIDNDSWKGGNYKISSGFKATKLPGINSATGSLTISYKSHEEYIREKQAAINKQKWTQAEILINTNLSLDTSKGGLIYVYIANQYPNLANTYNVTITIKDTIENELYSKQMPDLFPKMPPIGSIMWTNSNYISIPVQTDIRFYVYVTDSNEPKNIYKYKIESYYR